MGGNEPSSIRKLVIPSWEAWDVEAVSLSVKSDLQIGSFGLTW